MGKRFVTLPRKIVTFQNATKTKFQEPNSKNAFWIECLRDWFLEFGSCDFLLGFASMIRIRTILLAVIPFLAIDTSFARAGPDQEPIRFARTPDSSPDGEKIAFSYLGDVWTVDRIGGIARPVTLHEAHDFDPVFSPDGRWLAFSSNRHGSYDVFVVPVRGGKPRRLTFDSASDIVTGWSPDGKPILVASNPNPDFPRGFELD